MITIIVGPLLLLNFDVLTYTRLAELVDSGNVSNIVGGNGVVTYGGNYDVLVGRAH